MSTFDKQVTVSYGDLSDLIQFAFERINDATDALRHDTWTSEEERAEEEEFWESAVEMLNRIEQQAKEQLT